MHNWSCQRNQNRWTGAAQNQLLPSELPASACADARPRRRQKLDRAAASLLVMIGFCLSAGCQTSNTPAGSLGGQSDDGTVSFSTNLEPILTSICSTCHRENGIADQRGIALRLTADIAYDMLLNNNSVRDTSLPFVVAGDADSSLLFLIVSSDAPPGGVRMPFLLPALADSDIALIRDWINQGALNN